ncbi:MAG: PAS domain S-box protein [Lentimicrobium sp.]|nr:PAS domain S-box protein [Lentimicrobium sp.]
MAFKKDKSGMDSKSSQESLVYDNISFMALIENAPDGITMLDANGKIRYASPSARRILGYATEHIGGFGLSDCTHPDDLPMVMNAIKEIIEEPAKIRVIEFRIRTTDEVQKWIESTMTNKLAIPGLESIVFNFREITDRKKSENALRLSEEKFRVLLELASDAFFQGNTRGDFVTVNNKAVELTGYSREELLNMNINGLFEPDTLKNKPLNYQKLNLGEVLRNERRLKCKDGSLLEVEMQSKAMPDGTYQSFFRDITERKKAEVELERQRRFFEQMFLQSATSTQILDPEGWCLRVNLKLCEAFGVKPESIEGKVYNIFEDAEIKKNGIDKILKKVFNEHSVEQWEVYFDIGFAAESQGIKVEAGKKIWFANKAYPILDENGALLNVIIQHEDISERKNAEESLKIKERQLSDLINATNDIICFKDGAGRWLKANNADLELFGLIGTDYFMKKDSELAQNAHPMHFNSFLECEKTDEIAWLKRTPSIEDEVIPVIDGEPRTYEVIKTPVFNEDGSRSGLVVFGRDITHRKATEQALRESELKYRQMVEYTPDAIVIHAEDKILFVNPAALKLMGVDSYEQIRNVSLLAFMHPESREIAINRIKKVSETGIPAGFIEEKFVNLKGEIIEGEIISIPVQYLGQKAIQVIIRDVTDRKRATEALKESEDKFRTLAESSPYAIMIYQDDRWVYTNPAGEKLCGYSAEELCSMFFWEIVAEDYQEMIRERGKRRQQGLESTPSYEFKIRSKDGKYKWVYLSGSSLLYRGRLAGIISVIDITERKQTEDAIHRERMLLRTLIDNLPDTIYFKDATARKIVANRADLNLFGIKEESMALGKTDEELLGEEIGKRGYLDDLQVLNTGISLINSENDVIDGEGKLRWMLTSKIPLIDEEGRVNGLVGIGHDITDRRHAETVQQVLFQISNAVLTTNDLQQLFVIIRDQLGKLLDTTNFYIAFYDEKTGMLSTPYFTDEKEEADTWPAEKSATGYVINNKKSVLAYKADIERLGREGEIDIVGEMCEIWLGVPLMVEGKAIGAIVVQSYDNPDEYTHKDLEMLEFVSRQISLSIQKKKAEQDIRLALAKAEESDRLKTAFLNNMSHEIRTPLNGILGFTSLLDDPETTPEDQQYFYRIINQNGEQLLSIINDIISIATIEAGQEQVREVKTDVNDMLGILYDQFKLQSAGKQLILNYKTSLSSSGALIMTDETKLRQILANLIGNALKFTEQGMVEFGCNKEGSMLGFYVKDTGIGIPPDMHKAIFDRFMQARMNPRKDYGGNGLGLAISKAYVDLLGGDIWLKSTPGKGTTFYFTIPYNAFGIVAEAIKPETEILSGVTGKGKTLLIAEDVYANYQLLEVILKKLDYRIIHVENGIEAIDTIRHIPEIDLVLMDLKMPEMDGYQATGIIKQMRPELPVIAVTAYALGGDKEKALKAGCDDYICKPVKANNLIETINRFLKPKENN